MSTSSITTSTTSGTSRITGLISGLDVDSIVEQMINAEKAKLNKLNQQAQLAEWKQEQYREVISDIKSFAEKYFTITSSNSLIKQGNYQTYTATSDSSAVSVSAGNSATSGSHSITISQLATSAARESSDRLTKDVQGTEEADFTSAQGKSFIIDVDGTTRTITLDSSVSDVASLQALIDEEIGEGKVTASTANTDGTGALVFAAADDSGVQKITISSPTSDSALSALGFGDGAILTNRISTSDTLETIASQMGTELVFNDEGQVALTINGVEFTFDKADTLSDMMEEINESDAGVTLEYNKLSDKLVLTANQTGAGNNLDISESESNFLTAALDQYIAGQDAKMELDGQSLTRSSNSITVDGVTYTLKSTTSETATITIEQDVDAIYNNISSFVEDYNALIATLNAKTSEEYDYDYPPLTDDQKAEMTEDQIAKWEAKAKTGILRNDTLIEGLVSSLRKALIDSVPGQSLSLSQIGITTGTYDEKGKLYIDESALKEAIQNDPEGVMDLFTQQSSTYSGTTTVRTLDSSERQIRYNEEGIAYRIYDILQDNVSTTRDSNGNKGLMLEKAGLEGDLTENQNMMSEQIEDYLERIDKEEERLELVEERLYDKYSALETYINTMNNQLSTLLSYTSSES